MNGCMTERMIVVLSSFTFTGSFLFQCIFPFSLISLEEKRKKKISLCSILSDSIGIRKIFPFPFSSLNSHLYMLKIEMDAHLNPVLL